MTNTCDTPGRRSLDPLVSSKLASFTWAAALSLRRPPVGLTPAEIRDCLIKAARAAVNDPTGLSPLADPEDPIFGTRASVATVFREVLTHHEGEPGNHHAAEAFMVTIQRALDSCLGVA
jgi:hypothetical protein